jgi:hypothetical protein
MTYGYQCESLLLKSFSFIKELYFYYKFIKGRTKRKNTESTKYAQNGPF